MCVVFYSTAESSFSPSKLFLSVCLLWNQVLNLVSTLPGPCPWNWNFLVCRRVPFQQARTQLSFNHRSQSYRCVWLKYKVSLETHGYILPYTACNVFNERTKGHLIMYLIICCFSTQLVAINLTWNMRPQKNFHFMLKIRFLVCLFCFDNIPFWSILSSFFQYSR